MTLKTRPQDILNFFLKIFSISAIFLAYLFANPANASNSSGGVINNLTAAQDGNVWFNYTGSWNGTIPSCAEANKLWIVQPSQVGYEAIVSLLISAQARGATIAINGTGECGTTTHERIAYVSVNN